MWSYTSTSPPRGYDGVHMSLVGWGKTRNTNRILAGKRIVPRTLGILWRRLEDNVKTDLSGRGCENVNWTELT
jgi:hypothetical protein